MRAHSGWVVACTVAVSRLSGVFVQAFDPLPWDEAYEKAEETLSKMTIPLLEVSGLCKRQFHLNSLLLQPIGTTASGAPYYGTFGHYFYYDASCDGDPYAEKRWVLSDSNPMGKYGDMDGDGKCEDQVYTTEGNSSGPVLGTYNWSVSCGEDGNMTEIPVTLRSIPEGEKFLLLRGLGWRFSYKTNFYVYDKWVYIGNTPAIPRLGVPSLNMQDAAGGFRTSYPEIVETVTVWPSLLCMGATWDPTLVYRFGQNLGSEFKAKGANGILGPSLNLHRVARNGRNFEYMGGEDPYLGSILAKPYVKGVQSMGVFTVAKHWIFNEQETNRGTESSNVDDKVAFELYLAPFQAAVDAGASAIMCSYNREGGKYSCSSPYYLGILRNKLGFKGFVQSDWWASHDSSIVEGLDQEMPGTSSGDFDEHGEYFRASLLEQRHNKTAVDLAAKRVLAVMYRFNLFETNICTPPDCEDALMSYVVSPASLALARELAAKSVVMLKNEGGVLPLDEKKTKSILVLGAAANAPPYDPNKIGPDGKPGVWNIGDYYSGGGSGHVTAGNNTVTPLDGLKEHAALHGIEVISNETNTPDAAWVEENAKKVDAVFVVAGAISGEGEDRKNLSLDGGADLEQLIQRAAAANPKTVVLVMAPGAVLLPWRDEVAGILMMFLGGQEAGNGFVDVIYGDTPPQGRLPLTLPLTESDTIAPGLGSDVPYSEGLAMGYRNTNFQVAYPFGFGLTYTTFSYSKAELENCTKPCITKIRTTATNTGNATAPALLQLYLSMPVAAGQPSEILRGFQKTSDLVPGASEDLVFELLEKDMSYWSGNGGFDGWSMAPGSYFASIGEHFGEYQHKLMICHRHCDQATKLHVFFWLFMALAVVLCIVAGLFGYILRNPNAKRVKRKRDREAQEELLEASSSSE